MFKVLVAKNAKHINFLLQVEAEAETDAIETLKIFGANAFGNAHRCARDCFEQGRIAFTEVQDVLDLYPGLLIGHLQIRRVIGRAPVPSRTETERRTVRAVDALLRLHPVD